MALLWKKKSLLKLTQTWVYPVILNYVKCFKISELVITVLMIQFLENGKCIKLLLQLYFQYVPVNHGFFSLCKKSFVDNWMFDYRKVISFLLTHFVSLVLLLIGFNIVLENSWCYVMYNFSNKSCGISCKF